MVLNSGAFPPIHQNYHNMKCFKFYLNIFYLTYFTQYTSGYDNANHEPINNVMTIFYWE